MSKITMLSTTEFESQVEQNEGYVLVDYYADWCGPCKMIGPVLEQLDDEYKGQVKIVKLNADENPQVLGRYGVRGLPTLMMFKDGKPVDMAVGAQPYKALKGFIDRYVA